MAIEVAAEAAGAHDGIYFVPLASITEPELVVPTIVSTIGLCIEADYLERLVEYSAGKWWLLGLDNFERVLDAGPDVARLVADRAWPESTSTRSSLTSRRRMDPAELLSYEAVALALSEA